MVRELVWYGEDILKEVSEKVTVIDDEIKTLIVDMFETMYKENGAGLAAVQVGVLKRVIVISVPAYEESDDEFENDRKNRSSKNNEYVNIALINPEIVYESEEKKTCDEGCLSFPGLRDVVERAYQVNVKYLNTEGVEETLEAKGFMARALQHEIDHINGITFIDRLYPHQKKKLKRELKEIREMSKARYNKN